jgi:hypothetical protein
MVMKTLFFLSFIIITTTVYAQNKLVGTWKNDQFGSLVLKANGTGSFEGDAFTYTSNSSKIFVNFDGDVTTYSYQINEGKLIVSGGDFGQPVTFYKEGSSNKSTPNRKNTTESGGGIDKSIVGTWCWTNASNNSHTSSSNTRCIVIKGDGTYTYTYEGAISGYGGGGYGGSNSQESDYGTWRVKGNTIIVVSANSGTKTYSFQKKNHPKNGDPMIIIDGDAYVTYYQKSPW